MVDEIQKKLPEIKAKYGAGGYETLQARKLIGFAEHMKRDEKDTFDPRTGVGEMSPETHQYLLDMIAFMREFC